MPIKILPAAFASIFSVLATPLAFAQTAYFSLEGDFNAGGDQHNFTFDLSRSVTSNEVLRFETFANGGGTNAAGDVIASGGIDSDLRLRDSNNTVIGRNDDADSTLGAFDSLLSWPGVAPAPRNPFIELPSPLVAGGYSLNLTEFNNDQAGPWAIDLVGPADAITLTGASPAGTSTIDSLKFGTTGSGNSAGVFTATGTSEVTGQLVVAETGRATMNVSLGASVGSSSGVIGNGVGSTGVVTVTGADASGNRSTWTNSGDLTIGYDGNGTLNIFDGARVTNRAATLGEERSSSTNRVTVRGTDAAGNPSTWTNTGALLIGNLGSDSRLTIEGGGQVSSNSGSLGADIDDQSAVVVSGTDAAGNASRWSLTDKLSVGGGGSDASLTIQGGAHVSNQDSQIDNSQNGAINRVTVTGAGSTWTSRGRLLISDIGNRDAELLVSSGGRATGANAEIGFVPSRANPGLAGGIATVTGASSIWSLTGNLDIATSAGSIGATGDGTLNVSNGGTVTVGGATTIGANGAVNLSGGRFEFGALSFSDYQKINGVSGALVGSVDGIVLNGVNNINSVAAVPAISNIAPEVDVSEVIASSYTNRGLVFGAGSLNVGFTNDTTGEIQVITGQQMRFSGAGQNAGQVTLAGGQVEFTQGFTNQSGGLVLGFGGLRADGGTMNDGTMAFSATAAVIGDVTNNATGVISSSGGTTTFFDDVVNNGEVRTNSNSFTVYFGSYSGNGDTGTGTVIMEGDLKPGSSPGLMAFGGDLVLGDQSTTEIELGGLTPGTQSDQITVVDELALDGDLTVSLLPGYTPTLGDTFDLLTAASISGAFDSVTLPAASFELIYSASAVQLIATSALSGDYNNDGVVDAADYTVWRDNLNAPAGTVLNDTVGGAIGPAQYDAWASNFGATLPAAAAIPEPRSLMLLGLGVLVAYRRSES